MYANLELKKDLKELSGMADIKSIGKTVLKNDIMLIKTGNGPEKVLIISGHHALETITSKFLMEYLKNTNLDSKNVTLYVIPLLNVDGAEFHMKRIKNDRFKGKEGVWQANYRGIDLNHNYNAGFYIAKAAVTAEGINSPSHTKYGGLYPFSEPETRAVKHLCDKEKFSLAIALHTQGEEIYFGYDNICPENTFFYLDKFESASGYTASAPTGTASHSGFKDWFIKKYKKPAFTIEAGLGKNPLGFENYDNIYQKCGAIIDSLF